MEILIGMLFFVSLVSGFADLELCLIAILRDWPFEKPYTTAAGILSGIMVISGFCAVFLIIIERLA